jgi:class 3 adenylate cyclase
VCSYGETMAARLQALAEPGGIAVSESTRSSVKSKTGAVFTELRERTTMRCCEPDWRR